MAAMDPIPFEIHETARAIRREFDRRAQNFGATRAQWRLLARLGRAQPHGARQVDLADAMDVEPISLCRMVDRLERAGLVERRRDETDRRVWRVHLTDKAAPIIEELRSAADEFQTEAIQDISADDLEATRRVLAAIRSNLDKIDASARRKAS